MFCVTEKVDNFESEKLLTLIELKFNEIILIALIPYQNSMIRLCQKCNNQLFPTIVNETGIVTIPLYEKCRGFWCY